MDEKLKYQQIWINASEKAKDALVNGDMEAFNKYFQEMEDAAERYREACNFEDSTINANFATLNTTVESVLPKLMVKNKKA